jgi:hypothetical protein
MLTMKAQISALLFVFLMTSLVSLAQPSQSVVNGSYVPPPRDRSYEQILNRQRKVKEWPNLRESDILWKKRVWEEIDLDQKINYALFFPKDEKLGRKSLWHVIVQGLKDGDITAYKANAGPIGAEDDEFTERVNLQEVSTVMSIPIDVGEITDPYLTVPDTDLDRIADADDACPAIPGLYSPTPSENGCPPVIIGQDIERYRLKEDWIFDKQRSQRYVRIIGIAPMAKKANGDVEPLFWLYYDECRFLFSKKECFNMMNDAFKGTFEDLFETRHFSGYVIKEENIYDRNITDYAQGIDALLEGERIKKEIYEYEHDLWNY